jgi:enamine deaminase RidA (YjgF/YER057c/UK114 family)
MSRPEFFVAPGYGEKQLREFHYSLAVRVGNRAETSGQGGWDDDWNFPEALEDETAQAFDNVERTLAMAGASWRDVIHVNSYHVVHNNFMAQQFINRMGDRAPIWTAIGVPALGDPKMRVEIRVTAIVSDED